MKLISFSSFVNPYQYKIIEPGKKDIVFEFKIPRDYVAFIEQVANSWFPNTYYIFMVDWEEVVIEREIAPINLPKVFNPPILAKRIIRWIAYNKDTEPHCFEVLCDGYLLNIEEITRIF